MIPEITEHRRDTFLATSDAGKIDLDALCALLDTTYWANGRSREITARAIEHSLCFSLFDGDQLIGFLRVVTDYAEFAYLCDVVIDAAYRERGLGQWLLSCALAHPDVRSLKRWCLLTRQAQAFYEKSGFGYIDDPRKYMERMQPQP